MKLSNWIKNISVLVVFYVTCYFAYTGNEMADNLANWFMGILTVIFVGLTALVWTPFVQKVYLESPEELEKSRNIIKGSNKFQYTLNLIAFVVFILIGWNVFASIIVLLTLTRVALNVILQALTEVIEERKSQT